MWIFRSLTASDYHSYYNIVLYCTHNTSRTLFSHTDLEFFYMVTSDVQLRLTSDAPQTFTSWVIFFHQKSVCLKVNAYCYCIIECTYNIIKQLYKNVVFSLKFLYLLWIVIYNTRIYIIILCYVISKLLVISHYRKVYKHRCSM